MAKEFADSFYHTKLWKDCRKAYIAGRVQLDGGMCEKCHERLGYILHHKITLTPSNISNPDITLNHCNLQWVCKLCHDEEEGHGLNKIHESFCFFDSNGNPFRKVPPKNSP